MGVEGCDIGWGFEGWDMEECGRVGYGVGVQEWVKGGVG